MQLAGIAIIKTTEQIDDPLLMFFGHALKTASPRRGELDQKGTPVAGYRLATDQAFAYQLIGNAGDIAAGHHQPS